MRLKAEHAAVRMLVDPAPFEEGAEEETAADVISAEAAELDKLSDESLSEVAKLSDELETESETVFDSVEEDAESELKKVSLVVFLGSFFVLPTDLRRRVLDLSFSCMMLAMISCCWRLSISISTFYLKFGSVSVTSTR